MPDIAVARPFTLVLNDGTRHSFVPGIYRNQPAEIADHWFTKANLVPDEMPVDRADEAAAVDAAGVAALMQARALAEEQATRLRAELARVTVAWTESEMRARRAEAALAEAGAQVQAAEYSAEERNAAFAHIKSERDAAVARANEADAATTSAAGKIDALAGEFQVTPPVTGEAADDTTADEKVGDYVVRKRGKNYQIVKLDVYGKLVQTVAEFDNRAEAEAQANELKAKA